MTSFVFVNFCCFVLRILALMVNVLGILGTVKAGELPCRGVHLSFSKYSVGTTTTV